MVTHPQAALNQLVFNCDVSDNNLDYQPAELFATLGKNDTNTVVYVQLIKL